MNKSHNEALTAWKVELVKARTDLGTNVKALTKKEVALRDLRLQHVLLIRTLYGEMQSSAVKEVALHGSMASVEDETDEERAL